MIAPSHKPGAGVPSVGTAGPAIGSRRPLLAISAAVLLLTCNVSPADAAVTKVQVGVHVAGTNVSSISPTLSAPSTSGDLLVALIDTSGNTTVTAPSGWSKAKSVFKMGAGSSQIWYEANNPGGVSSATFSLSPSDSVVAQLSEWSGIELASPLDGSGSATAASGASLTVSATAADPNELAITNFKTGTATTFTPAGGWTNLLPASSNNDSGDYQIGVGSGTVSEAEGANTSTSWAGVIATFQGSCGGGSLSITPPATISFGTLALTGLDQSSTTNLAPTVTDATGTGTGWNVTGTSTQFRNSAGKTLPTTATTVTAGSAAATAGTCDMPTNQISYPLVLPAAATAPTAVKLFDAKAQTGLGQFLITLAMQLSVPASAYSGTYTSTWTVTIASGP